jgi:hypothetical protein
VDRLAFRDFGALVGLGCFDDDDEYLIARAELIMAMWEKRMAKMVPEDLRPITMVMYSAALLPTGKECLVRRSLSLKLTCMAAFRKNAIRPEPDYLCRPTV